MSSKRQITLKLTTQKDLIKHESDARTFGELKAELSQVKWDGMRVVERSTKNTLQIDDAILPAQDFLLFLVPEKVKSGQVEEIEDIENAPYNTLRSHISFLNKVKDANININGGVEEIRGRLKDFYSKDEEDISDLVEVIEAAQRKINEAIDVLIETAKLGVPDKTEYLVKTSIDDLADEFAAIKSSLKL